MLLLRLLLAALVSAAAARAAVPSTSIPSTCRQLVVVTTDSWKSSRATLGRYTRTGPREPWRSVAQSMSAVTGQNGLAWGRGLHAIPPRATRSKREGDRCAPAGVFRIIGAFGQLTQKEIGPLRLPYHHVDEDWEAVDDPASRYYNRIVDRKQVARPDWRSSERLSEGRHYRIAIDLAHNPRHVPGAGSCIFLHEWIGGRSGTAGCTVLRAHDLLTVIRWLDATADPVLVQAPKEEAAALISGKR